MDVSEDRTIPSIPNPDRDNVASSLYRLRCPDSTDMRVIAVVDDARSKRHAACGISNAVDRNSLVRRLDFSYPYLLMVHYTPSSVSFVTGREQMEPELGRVQRDFYFLCTAVNENR